MSARGKRILSLGILLTAIVLAVIFSPASALLGDINLDDIVNKTDLDAIAQLLGFYQTNPGFDRFRDLNLDNDIDVEDLAIAGRSYGSTRNFHYPRQISNTGRETLKVSSCLDASDRIHIIWSETGNVYYTRLDRFGNTLIDDLLLEQGGFVANTAVAIGCDEAGNSHMIWDCSDSIHGTCQARIDQFGFLRIKNRLDSSQPPSTWPAIDIDTTGNAHVLYTQYSSGKTYYDVINPLGKLLIAQQIVPAAERYHELVLDPDDTAHLLYPIDTDTYHMVYQRISPDSSMSLAQRTIGDLGWGGYNDSIRPSLAVDSERNAFASYITFDNLPPNLYLEKIDASGNSIVDDLLIPEFEITPSGGAQTDIAVDSGDNLHIITFSDFRDGAGVDRTVYGIFDNNGETLQPLRATIYDQPIRFATLLLDSHHDSEIVYKAGAPTGYPPCDDLSLCFQGTSFEANTYNLDLPDLGTDVTHSFWDPYMLRWNNSVTITGTVFNTGWYTSTATTVRVSVAISDTIFEEQAWNVAAIPSLDPYEYFQFHVSLDMPHDPPPGYEGLEFLRLILDVDPADLILETSEANNLVTAPMPVEPLPTSTKLYLVVHDDTFTVLGDPNSSELVNTGMAVIEGPEYPKKKIEVTNYWTVLGNDIPVRDAQDTYTVSWEAVGFRAAAPVEIGVMRNPSDPYKIDYTPLNTAVIVTDRWASMSGTITKSDGGGGLADAKVRIVGQGLSLEAATDAGGNYPSSTASGFNKLIPGDYQVRISRVNYARIIDTITLSALETRDYDRVMSPTSNAYLHGNVINEFGNPVANAKVVVCDTTLQTDEQGVFDAEVIAGCTTLEISHDYYATLNETLSMTAGLETLLTDMTLIFDPPVSMVNDGDRVASRVIDVSTGGMLPDAPPDAGFALSQLYEKFKDEFWIDYRILVLYGCYEYNLSAAYTGAPGDYQLKFAQVLLAPRTFEVHMSLSSIDLLGVTIPIPIVSDSGESSALYAIEMRLVNTETGQVIKTVYQPIEGGTSWKAFADTTKTYDFEGASFTDTNDTEVWLYLKVGKNVGGTFDSPPQLYQFNQQILKLDLSSGDVTGMYQLGSFPLPH